MFFITDSKIDQVNDILPALEIAARESRPFVLVADEVEGQALAAMIMNTMRGSMKVAAVKAPRYGEERRAILSDLATATGAKFFQQSMGDKIAEANLTDFGTARKVEIGKRFTTVVDGDGDTVEVETKIERIKEEINQTDDLHEAERLQDRITRLSSGVAIIRVGASTEVEMIEKKHRVEDALEAVRSAQQEGVVPGGGMMLLRIANNLAVNFDNEDQASALSIFKNALQSPFRTMAQNAGMSPDVTMWCIQDSEGFDGYDFATVSRTDLLKK